MLIIPAGKDPLPIPADEDHISMILAQSLHLPLISSEVAIQMAEGAVSAFYGHERLAAERPFTAKKREHLWIVSAAAPSPGINDAQRDQNADGHMTIVINCLNGRILKIAG